MWSTVATEPEVLWGSLLKTMQRIKLFPPPLKVQPGASAVSLQPQEIGGPDLSTELLTL